MCISFALLYWKTELMRSWSAIIGPKLFFTRSWLTISLHNNCEDDKHAHGFADF
jgi:hypothetical protein